ncbi:MAG: NUDIX domain-containing protein [Candidatus Marsarchaeota archaeon]|jgi:8-oxo-dGTP pyrophosphatase MutT (NUDIX family)|nr:NUDIX domain-containing protein [Candidatus Marsarchaeota archaeon]
MTKKCIVAGCLVINDGKILMLEHNKLGAWLYPGGHIEENEFPYEAAIRETKEETGLDVELLGNDNIKHIDEGAHTLITPFAIVYENVPYKTQPMHIHFDMVYVAKVIGGSISTNSESTGSNWFSREEMEKLDTLPNVKDIAIKAMESYPEL